MIGLVGRGPSFGLLKCVKMWFMFVYWNGFFCGLFSGSDFVPETSQIVGFAASSLACNSASCSSFFCFFCLVGALFLSLISRSYSVLWYSQGAFARIWLNPYLFFLVAFCIEPGVSGKGSCFVCIGFQFHI